jgi:hypothetical protein
MEVLSHFIEEEVEELIWDILASGLFSFRSDLTNKTIELILRE